MSDAGFSLVEMMIALTITGMMASVVVLSILPRQSAVSHEAERLLARFHEAQETALVSGQMLGFAARVDGSGYLFLRFEAGEWRGWPDHPVFADTDLPVGMTVLLTGRRTRADAARDSAAPLVPEAWFDPTGVNSGFAYRLAAADGERLVERTPEGALRVIDPSGVRS